MMKARQVLPIAISLMLVAALPAAAEIRPRPAPNRPAPIDTMLDASAPPPAASAAQPAPAKPAQDPNRGSVTSMPLPRFVTLKGREGNARRGPGLTHRIDWVFTQPGMPLRVTAEYDNWRLVEDSEGAGGWIHYALLSGSRAVLVQQDLTPFYSLPDTGSAVVFKAETGVIARILQCEPDWCRLQADGQRGWAEKTAFWGVDPGEIVD